jgi:hypothetical protein
MLQSLDGPADQPLIGTDQQVGSLHLQFLRGASLACGWAMGATTQSMDCAICIVTEPPYKAHVVFDMAVSMDTELQPGERAPITGAYEELNIFGTRTGRVHVAQEGDALPPCPRGFSWREVDRSAS